MKLQYNRNRYYSQDMGRWLTKDPLGITPNPQPPNYFDVKSQYKDGLNLYEYVNDNPVIYVDEWGLRGLGESIIPPDRPHSRCTWKEVKKEYKFSIGALIFMTIRPERCSYQMIHYNCGEMLDVLQMTKLILMRVVSLYLMAC